MECNKVLKWWKKHKHHQTSRFISTTVLPTTPWDVEVNKTIWSATAGRKTNEKITMAILSPDTDKGLVFLLVWDSNFFFFSKIQLCCFCFHQVCSFCSLFSKFLKTVGMWTCLTDNRQLEPMVYTSLSLQSFSYFEDLILVQHFIQSQLQIT